MLFLALKKVQMVKIIYPQVSTIIQIKSPKENFASPSTEEDSSPKSYLENPI